MRCIYQINRQLSSKVSSLILVIRAKEHRLWTACTCFCFTTKKYPLPSMNRIVWRNVIKTHLSFDVTGVTLSVRWYSLGSCLLLRQLYYIFAIYIPYALILMAACTTMVQVSKVHTLAMHWAWQAHIHGTICEYNMKQFERLEYERRKKIQQK